MGNRALFWDFDGTLVYCHHLWSGSVYRVLWDYEEAADVSPEQIFPLRAHGYPWEEPDEEAFRYQTSEGFWAYMHDRFERDFLTLGLMPEHAKEAAGKVRAHILNPRYYYLYEDTRKTLALCRQMGWENHLLSNNYPELPATMKALNLWDLFDTVTVSALDAFETQKFARDTAAGEEAASRVRRMLRCDLMILDDLGTEMPTSFAYSALYTLVNTRLLSHLPTIISTNLSAEELRRRCGTQVASRLEGEFIELPFVGRDIRQLPERHGPGTETDYV